MVPLAHPRKRFPFRDENGKKLKKSHEPLFLGGAGQFLEHIRAKVFPDESILVEQSKAANLSPLRRFGVQAYRPGRRFELLEELAKRGLCFGGGHVDEK